MTDKKLQPFTQEPMGHLVSRYTTLSVEKSIKPLLEQAMLKIGKKMSYSEIIAYLANDYIDKN